MTLLPIKIAKRIKRRFDITLFAASADCFLVSYPKSGRTWFRFLLSHYFSARSASGLNVDLHTMFSVLPNFDLDPVRGVPAFGFNRQRSTVPRIWVSHLAFRRSLFLNKPAIVLVRDPRDVAVSSYFHATRHKHRFEGDIEQFLEDPAQGVPAMCAYLNGWAKGIAGRRSHILSYEALTLNPASEVIGALRFLERDVDIDAVDAAVQAGSFTAMQKRELVEGLPAHDYDRTDTESLRMRRGQAGGYTDYLSPQMVRKVEDMCRHNLSTAAKSLLERTGIALS
jgi:hypothetical protein